MVRHVLVVDDEPDHAASLRDLFERLLAEPTQVDTAASLAEARRLLGAGRYDLVISDEGMPGGRGTELLRWFHAQRPEVPTILISAYPEDSIGPGLIRSAGVTLFLLKPFEQAEMLRLVERLLAAAEAGGALEGVPRAVPSRDGRAPG